MGAENPEPSARGKFNSAPGHLANRQPQLAGTACLGQKLRLPMRRTELFLFLACWLSFAWFHQGGGWNQNARFAEVRAIVEQGRFAIDDFLVYRRTGEGDGIRRLTVQNGEFEWEGKRQRLCWVDGAWNLYPVGEQPLADGVVKAPMVADVPGAGCASGDVSFVPHTGHFHPNKPPGTSFLGVPAYWLIFKIERALGLDPDAWWTLNVNLWLTTVFSIGLLAALGAVLFFRLAVKFADGQTRPALLATIALAFGTTFFPFATIFFDHAATAVLLLAAFYLLSWERCRGHGTCALRSAPPATRDFLAGLAAGMAVLTNYVAAGAVVALGLYALLAGSVNVRRALVFALGGLPMAGLLAYYNVACFGQVTALNNDFQNPIFADPSGMLGMFGLPNPYVAALITVSPYRGVFCLAPVLVFGIAGWVIWLRAKTWVPEARLGLAIFAFFFLVNASFNGYHAGYSAGPRYLVPGLPFLALPLVVAFARWAAWAKVLLAISVVQQFLLTVTDGQNPLAVGGHARIDDAHRKDDFFCSIVWEYAAPLFFTGKVGPLLAQMADIKADAEAAREPNDEVRPAVRAERRAALQAAIDRGDRDPFLLAAIRGPVSVNPVAPTDGLLGWELFPLGDPRSARASFNAGELLFPQSRWSIVPLLVLAGGLLVLAARGTPVKT